VSYPNVIGADPRPPFFCTPVPEDLQPPAPRREVAVRAMARTLAGMQKEAVVASMGQGPAWRLVSDEGPALDGHQEAPVPLAFLTAGLVASWTEEMVLLAGQRGVDVSGLCVQLDNLYTTEGSALRGTMLAGALPPTLAVGTAGGTAPERLRTLCADAVNASPVNGLVRGVHTSLFTLTVNGDEVPTDKAGGLQRLPEPDADLFDRLVVAGPQEAGQLILRLPYTGPTDPAGDAPSSGLREDRPKRTLNVRGICTLRPDGMKVIDVRNAHRNDSPVWRFLSQERSGDAGTPTAPDAVTLVSAGIAFCFMTQLGRYARVAKQSLADYRVVQDLHFSGPGSRTGRPGEADAAESHVYLRTEEDEEAARTLVRMGRQTCYLHALCETDLRPRLRVGAQVA
jgi:uncharacterized OsmC-like protein